MYCYDASLNRLRYWGIFFIDVSSASSAQQAFSMMATTCRVGKSMEDFKRCLTVSLEPWLLILDNADEPSSDVSQYFPVGFQGTIIVTSRNPACKMHATAGFKELHNMERSEATTLLLTSAGMNHMDERLRSLAQSIVYALGYLALAIVYAGASIRNGITSPTDYLELYGRHRKKLLGDQPSQVGISYEYTVYTTWNISVDSIRQIAETATDDTAANALELLNLFGYYHFDDITEEMFIYAWGNLRELEHYPWWASNQIRLFREYEHSQWDPLPLREAIHVLSSYSLIHFGQPDHRISLHPLVHSWIRDSLTDEAQLKWWTTAISTLAMASDPQMFQSQRRLAVHMSHCMSIRNFQDLFLEHSCALDKLEITYWVVQIFVYSNRYEEGLPIAELAVTHSRELVGESYMTSRLVRKLAYIYNELSESQKTITLLEDMVTKRFPGAYEADFETLGIRRELSRAYRKLGRTQEALELAQKNLKISLEVFGEKDHAYLMDLEELALVYSNIGRYEEALELSVKALGRRKETLGEDDYDVLQSEYLLARTYTVSKRHEDARIVYEHLLEKFTRTLGEDDPDTLHTKVKLGEVYGFLGRPENGIPLVNRAIEIGSKTGSLNNHDLEYGKKCLEELEIQSVSSFGIGPRKLVELPKPLLESKKHPGRRGWKL